MRCQRGLHEWVDRLDAERCCNPAWTRITIPPGARVRDVLEDKRVAPDGINHAPDGFKFAWMRTTVDPSP
jgi:hypothetical protein